MNKHNINRVCEGGEMKKEIYKMADNRESAPESIGKQVAPAEYEYQTLMQLLGVSVSKHLLDEHFTLVWANEFYYQLIDWPKDEYEAKFHNRPDLYYQRDRDEWNRLGAAVQDAVLHHRDGYQLLARMRRRSGDFIWVQFSTKFADEYVNGYQVAYTVMTNIDDLVRIQKEQSVTYESLPGYVAKCRVDRELRLTVLDGNSRFMEYYRSGSGEDSPYQQNMEKNRDVILKNRDSILAGEPVHFILNIQNRMNQNMWLKINANCVDWQDGCPVYLIIFLDITDETELREMQKKLTKQKEALKEALTVAEYANRAKSDFLSRMSHEIRTPMNAVIGMTTIAAAHIDDQVRVADCLEKIGYASKHLMTLINDVLDMSKIEGGKMTIAHDAFNLEKVAESITSIIYPQVADKGLKFTMPLVDVTDTALIGDSLRLNQVLINLLSNALKFTPEGGTVRLEIRQLQRLDDRVRLRFTVSDTGIGMSREFVDRLFVPFEQESVSTSHQYGGTGLGMAITKNLVTLMGGTISVKSEKGQGSTFIIEMDFGLANTGNEIRPQKRHELESLKVLIADDDRDSCLHTSLVLEKLRIKSDWVITGRECLELVQAAHRIGEDYDVCLVDWRMPDMDGIEVTRHIRSLVGPDTTVIIITAYDFNAIEERARDAGANAFITKPVFASTLYNALLSVTGIERAVKTPGENMKDSNLTGRRVLLVEDNQLNQEIALELLKMAGVSVDCAEDGREAVRQFLKSGSSYDAILMDVQMPVMDGYEATVAIRESGHPCAHSIPIIAMTADTFQEDIVKAGEAGMDGHLAKPIDPEMLYRVLAEKIDNSGS